MLLYYQITDYLTHYRHKLEPVPAETGGNDYLLAVARQKVYDEVLVGRIGVQAGFQGVDGFVTSREVFIQHSYQLGLCCRCQPRGGGPASARWPVCRNRAGRF